MFVDEHAFVPINDPEAARRPWIEHSPSPPTFASQQLRLFASELAFMTLAITDNKFEDYVVVYAGAAPGKHIPALASLFPKTPFFLYDIEKFVIEPTEQMTLCHEYFTDETARAWGTSGKKVIFISDIRCAVWAGRVYKCELQLMTMQAQWLEIMLPVWWSVKFRIPYAIVNAAQTFPYLGGHLLFQPFGNPLTMELHLVGNMGHVIAGSRAVDYESRVIEEMLSNHNHDVRPVGNMYSNVFTLKDEPYSGPHASKLDNSYDVTYLMFVADVYMRKSGSVFTPKTETEAIDFVMTLVQSFTGQRNICVGKSVPRPMRPPGTAVFFDIPVPAAVVAAPPPPAVVWTAEPVVPKAAPKKKKAMPAPAPAVLSTKFVTVTSRKSRRTTASHH